MSLPIPHRRWLGGLAAAALLVLVMPLSVSAHSELKSSDPAEGATVPSPFTGPVVLTFTEHLADGSKADLVGPDGSTVATATMNAGAPTMTFTLASTLVPGVYQAKWTSIADDGDLLRGIVKFSVAAATPTPEPSITSAPSATAETSPSVAATAEAATPAPSPASDASGGGSDVILPIVIVLIIVAAGAFYLVRRNRPA